MNDRAKYKGRMAIYAMAGVYLLAQAYYMYKDIPTSSGTDKTLMSIFCLLYTSDAADEEDSVDYDGRRINKKKKKRTSR